jgi:hypothetical protein
MIIEGDAGEIAVSFIHAAEASIVRCTHILSAEALYVMVTASGLHRYCTDTAAR